MRLYGHVIWVFLVYVAASSNQKLLSSRCAGGTDYTCAAILGTASVGFWKQINLTFVDPSRGRNPPERLLYIRILRRAGPRHDLHCGGSW